LRVAIQTVLSPQLPTQEAAPFRFPHRSCIFLLPELDILLEQTSGGRVPSEKRSLDQESLRTSVFYSSDTASADNQPKRVRSATYAEMIRMRQELSRLNDAIRWALAHERKAESTEDAQVRKMARDRLLSEDSDLHHDSMVAMLDIFKQDILQAETYLCLKRDSRSKVWIRRTLKKHGRMPDLIVTSTRRLRRFPSVGTCLAVASTTLHASDPSRSTLIATPSQCGSY
jgi:hypothetical protein